MKRINLGQMILSLVLIVFSAFTVILILFDVNKPFYYDFLFLLPLTFLFLSIFCNQLYRLIPSNLGVSIIIILFFCRMVITPLLFTIADYPATITKNIESNTTYSIFLICYEAFAIFSFLLYKVIHKKPLTTSIEHSKKLNYKYFLLLLLILFLILLIIKITPEILLAYRTVFQINDEYFVNFEDAQITKKYGTTFIKKLSLTTGFYLTRAAIILFPAYGIIFFSQKKHTALNKFISLILCFTPLFFIAGAIAKSLIYMICLFLLRSYLYPSKRQNFKLLLTITIGGTVAIAWWLFRVSANNIKSTEIVSFFATRFMTYFSGVNIVSGVFNLPKDLVYKLRYFLYDYLDSIPYGNTIFDLSHEGIQTFFNFYNNTFGQIPTTIGMGWYYFGPIFSPLYSIIFSYISYQSGERVKIERNPFKRLRLLLMIFYFAMGIIMYNIEITFTSFFSLFLPMYFMERIAYKKEK
ncbi:MAG: oligosaccharide repeat unit polymerase [Clostridia bacterium]|nr:oligosaccharide repeat unit polymerase [Clostridia bacterium]